MAEEPERQLAAAQQSLHQVQQQLLEHLQHAEQVSLSSSDLPFQVPSSLAALRQLTDIFQVSGLLPFEVAETFWCLTSEVNFITRAYHRVYITGSRSSHTSQLALWQKIVHTVAASSCLLVQT